MTTTAKLTRDLSDLHFENQLWSSEIKFFIDELIIYQNRLDEVVSKNTNKDLLKYVEHFQNQFYIQKNEIATIKHLVNEHEQWLAKYAMEHPISIDHVKFADHVVLKDKMITFNKLYTELKMEFMKFLSHTM